MYIVISHQKILAVLVVIVMQCLFVHVAVFAVDLTVWSFNNQPLPDSVLRAFEQVNQGVAVKQTFPTGDFRGEGFLLASVAGVPPDLIHLNADYLPMYVAHNLVVPITRYINMGLFGEMGRYFPGTVSSYEGEIYFIPHRQSTNVILYNRDIFNAAGLDANSPPTTWNEFQVTARRLTRSDSQSVSQYGVQFSSTLSSMESLNNWYLPALWQSGGDLLRGNRVAINNDAGRAALKFFAEPIIEKYGAFGGVGNFRAGKAGMFLVGTSVTVRDLKSRGLSSVDVGHNLQNKEKAGQGSLAGWVVPKGPNSELATKLLAFTLDPKNVREFLQSTKFLPVRPDIGINYFDPEDRQWAAKFIAEQPYIRFDILHPELRSLMPIITHALKPALDGRSAPVNIVIEEAERLANVHLKNAGY